jgi:hypothetical protein
VPIHKWQICPISALRKKFNPQNISHMPVEDPEPFIGAVKFFTRLDLDQIILFVDGHYLKILKFAYLNGNFKCAAGEPAILAEWYSSKKNRPRSQYQPRGLGKSSA